MIVTHEINAARDLISVAEKQQQYFAIIDVHAFFRNGSC